MTASPATGATLVWLVLVVATAGSARLAEHHGAGAWTVPVVMLVAVLKVRLVVLHFMEMKQAPWAGRVLFEAWPLLCAGIIVGVYWLPPH